MAQRIAIVVLCAVLCSAICILPSAGAAVAPLSSTDVFPPLSAHAVDMPPAAVQAGLSPHAWQRIMEQIRADQACSALAQDVSALACTQKKKLTASDGAASDQFGIAVAIWGDTLVVGARYDDVGTNKDQGSAYVFYRNRGGAENWGQVKKLVASDGAAGDEFGMPVAIWGDTIVVGSSRDDVGANADQGSAYVFYRNQGGADNWGLVKKLTASDGAAGDLFGWSLGIWGDTIVVTAHLEDVGGSLNRGSAYVFYRNRGGTDNWGLVKQLTASDGRALDFFGYCVGIWDDTIVVTAHGDDVSGTINQGSAYVFYRNRGGADNWGEVKKLTASDGAAQDYFGFSVAIWGYTIVVGVCWDDVGGKPDQGSAYVFYRNRGGADNWGQVKKLTASDGAAGDYFGISVDIWGDTVMVGADLNDVGGKPDQGSAYIFYRNQGGTENWGEVKELTASDGAAGDVFGNAVTIWGDTVVVGAYADDVGGKTDQGSAYIFGCVVQPPPTRWYVPLLVRNCATYTPANLYTNPYTDQHANEHAD